MNSGQNVWTFCHNLPHAQTLKNFLRYSVNVGVQSGQSPSLCQSLDFPYPDLPSPSICPGPELSQLPTPSHASPQWLQAIPVPVSTYTVLQLPSWKAHFSGIFLSSGDSLPFPICYPGPLWPLFHTTCYQSEMFAHNNWKQKVKCSSYVNDQCFIISWKCELFFHFLGTGYNKQLVGCCLWNMSVLHGPYFEMIILKR